MQFKNRSHKSLFLDISVHSNVHGSKYLCRKILYFRHRKWVFNEGLRIRKNTYCPTSNKNNNNRDEKMVTNTFDNEIDDALRSK